MTSLKRGTKWYFIGGLLALALTVCWAACVPSSTPAPTSIVGSSATPTDTTVPFPMPTMTPKPVTTAPPMPASTPSQTEPKEMIKSSIGGQGIAIHLSDVGTIPDFVNTQGEVLFIPEEHAEDLAEMVDFDPSKMSYISHALFQLDESQFAKLAGAAAVIGADGRFPLDISAGPYFVCLAASLSNDHTAGPPYSVGGCALIDLPNDASLTVTWGEGGGGTPGRPRINV